MQVQLARLFGTNSAVVKKTDLTDSEWRRTLREILKELDSYRRANVHTDGLHDLILDSGLAAADEALKEDDFWPGYVEGIVRFCLTLMGDYPDHRRRKRGRRKDDHYLLNLRRTVGYYRTPEQQFRTLYMAVELKVFGLSSPMWQVLSPFYEKHGYRQSRRVILSWFRAHYPDVYSAVFP